MFFQKGFGTREHEWDHASADLELRELSSGRESWFPVIALVREITFFPGCRPEPSNLPPRESSHPWAETSHALSCVLQYALFPVHLLENTLQ